MERDAAYELHVKSDAGRSFAPGLAHGRKRVGQKLVERLAARIALAEDRSDRVQLVV